MTKITVREIGRRKFEIDYTLNLGGGKRKRRRLKSPFDTKGKSLAWAQKLLDADVATGGEAKVEPPRADPDAPRSFAYWGGRYLAEATSPAKRGGPDTPGTLRSKKNILTTHLVPAFGKRVVTAIDDEAVEAYLVEKSTAGLASSTLRLHCNKLRGALRLAKRKGNDAERQLEVPTVGVSATRGEKLPKTLSETETDFLLAVFEDAPPWQLALLTLLFRGGLRCSEALGLRWGDIDFARETIRIQRKANRDGVGFTKGGKIRVIPVHWQIRDALRLLGPSEGWVFKALEKTSTKPRSYTSTLQAIRPRWDACGFADEDGPIKWHTHIGRHSLGRHWAERGWPFRGLQDLLGHADLSTTEVYMHWAPAASGPLIQQLGGRRLRAVK